MWEMCGNSGLDREETSDNATCGYEPTTPPGAIAILTRAGIRRRERTVMALLRQKYT